MTITETTLTRMGGAYTDDVWERAPDHVRKAMIGSLAAQDETIRKSVMAGLGYFDTTQEMTARFKTAGATDALADAFAKSITTATGLVAYDLQAPAKNLYPYFAPIRNRIPRVGGGVGTATNWRAVNAIVGSGYDTMAWVPEGARSGQMSYATANKSASYVTLGEEDAATYEAISAGRTFEDIQARMTFRLLQKMMMKEEMAILAGNSTLQLGTPAQPSTSASGTGGTLPATNYFVRVVALTVEGFSLASLAGGVSQTRVVTSAGGQNTYTLNGGSSNISASSASQTVGSAQTLFASVPAIQGAVAYAWYIGTAAGAETLQAITTINSMAYNVPLVAGRQAGTAITADCSANGALAFDGLMTTAFLAGNNAYVKIQATGTSGTGTPLTASGRGSVTEIDVMLQTLWQNFKLSPTVMYVNAQELTNITNKVFTGTGSAPLLRYDATIGPDGNAGPYGITAGGVISYYYNPYAPPDAGMKMPVRIHDRVPPGTIVVWCENLPIQYQSNEVPNVAEVKTRQDYYQIDWPITTRQKQVGVYAEEVLAVYAPFAMGIITNIGNG